MTPAQQEFYIEEFKALRKEIEQRIAESGKVVNAAFIWIGAALAWLLGDGNKLLTPLLGESTAHVIALLVPVWISIWATARIGENEYKIQMLGNYIRKTEVRFEIVGWEHRSGDRKIWQGVIVWAWLLLSTVALEFIVIFSKR